MGFHLSPSADQDTHWTNWGTVTAARTAVWADGASYADLMKAFRANRVYATEDDELAVTFQVNYNGSVYWMGETVSLAAEEADVELRVNVWQSGGSDGDDVNEGPYTITLVRAVASTKLVSQVTQISFQTLCWPSSMAFPHTQSGPWVQGLPSSFSQEHRNPL